MIMSDGWTGTQNRPIINALQSTPAGARKSRTHQTARGKSRAIAGPRGATPPHIATAPTRIFTHCNCSPEDAPRQANAHARADVLYVRCSCQMIWEGPFGDLSRPFERAFRKGKATADLSAFRLSEQPSRSCNYAKPRWPNRGHQPQAISRST